MSDLLEAYRAVAGDDALDALIAAAAPMRGKTFVHVNSTREGGGVAEILHSMLPLMEELGIDARWEVIDGYAEFFDVTKAFHNGLQGNAVPMTREMLDVWEANNADNARRLGTILGPAEVVFIHDPQPAPQLSLTPDRNGPWIWRCHIDMSKPHPPVWDGLRPHVEKYDASVTSMKEYAQPLPHHQAIIPPSINPLSEKNVALDDSEITQALDEHGIDGDRPIALQVSRYDRFKDPIGVVKAYKIAKKKAPSLQLVYAGGGATDDPEGAEVLAEVREIVGEDADCHILLLPSDAHRTINALQRAATVVMQKSLREGFGLTVTEAMWKGKPTIGGDTGGIRIQIDDGVTGYLVGSVEQCAQRILDVVADPDKHVAMGARAREHVRKNFLLTTQTTRYIALAASLMS